MQAMPTVSLLHGAGGAESRDFIDSVFLPNLAGSGGPQEDAALIAGGSLAMTIDAFVVDPPQFPGGDIGKLAVCGTVNDLAVRGAIPRWLAVSWVLPEGMSMSAVSRYAESLGRAAAEAGIQVVAGDTKVVPAGELSGPAVTTCGVGEVVRTSSISRVGVGDVLVLSGRVGDHTAALVAAREGLLIDDLPPSDCALLHNVAADALEAGAHFARDVTRGGASAVLWEVADATGLRVEVVREAFPVHPAVAELCQLVGLDPLSLANEGCLLLAAPEAQVDAVVSALRGHPEGANATVVGRIRSGPVGVFDQTGGRSVPLPHSTTSLPRLC